MLLALCVAGLFGLAALTPIAFRLIGRDAAYLNASVVLGLTLLVGSRWGEVIAGEPVSWQAEWLPTAGVSLALRMDGVGLLFALIVLGIGALIMAYSARYFSADRPVEAGRYVALLTLFAGSMLGLVLADDLVLLVVFWELTSVSSFFLIGGKGEGRDGAVRAFVTTTIGGLALLVGVLLIGTTTGSFSIAAMTASPEAVAGSALAPAIAVLVLLAAATKSALFPFQFWLPGAMVAPTPVSAYLHAATMVKGGIYLLFRFSPVFGDVALWRVTLVLLGLGTAVFAAYVALKRTDLKALLAYSTVSQLGLIAGLIGIGTPLALAAAGLHTLAHALFKAALFLTVGVLERATGTRDLAALGGLRRALPFTAAAGALGAVSMAGLPPLLGFVSKEEALAAFVAAPGPGWLAPLAVTLMVLASVGTVAYSARCYLGAFEGELVTPARAIPRSFAAPALLAAIAGLVLGPGVPIVDPLVDAVSRDTAGIGAEAQLALWHGFTLPLALSAIVILGGTLLVLLRRRVEVLQGRFTTPTGAGSFDRLYDHSLAFGAWIGRPARSHRPAVYIVPVLAVLVATGVSVLLATAPEIGGEPAPSLAVDWAVVLLLAGCIGGVVQAGSRLAAVATLGLTGFTVAAWFVLIGAPDLALTQLLVESLTVALVVVVFRRLPRRFERGQARRKLAAGLAAATTGVLAGGATYLLTGRRPLSPIGARLLAEGEGLTGGANVVNTILVDFRALDTLGEIAVLGVAAAGIFGLVRLSERRAIPRPARARDPRWVGPGGSEPAATSDQLQVWAGGGMIDSPVLSTATVALAPAMVAASLWLLVRGHDAVGGGFIGGLTAGAAAVLLYFSRGHGRIWNSRLLRVIPLVGSGLVIAALYGLGGLALTGAFLAGAKLTLPFGIVVAASLLFDVGVYLVVVGMVVVIVRHLGQGLKEEEADPSRMVAAARASTPDAGRNP